MIYSHPAWEELAHYLSLKKHPFRGDWCNSFDVKVTQARRTAASDAAFYRDTEVYLYQNIGFFLDHSKVPYYGRLFQCIGTDAVTLLDYGCGSGHDGLWFLAAGYQVSFADVPSRGLDFLRWRCARLGYPAPIYELSTEGTILQHDIVWCIDVLEHMPPERHQDFLLELEGLGRTVFVTLVDDKKADSTVHYPVAIQTLTHWVAGRRHTWHQDYHPQPDGGRVRLLVIGERARRLSGGA